MTTQVMERLIYQGEEVSMAAEPLREYLSTHREFSFSKTLTCCRRGYVGEWLIGEDSKLYLVALRGGLTRWNGRFYEAHDEKIHEDDFDPRHFPELAQRKIDRMHTLFPGKERVFAAWYSAEIRIPHGERLLKVHMGYGSLYEKELYLEIDCGVVVSKREKDNKKVFEELSENEQRKLGKIRHDQS